jgi:hypothetical protein
MHLDLMRHPSKTFPVVDRAEDVVAMRAWHCQYKTFEPLSHYKALKQLVIGSFPDDDLNILRALPELEHLSILHLPGVADIEPLAGLQRLSCLSLSTTPSWDQKRRVTTVSSLVPLAQIPSLQHLELFGVCPPDRSLSSLEGCRSLKTARFSQYPLGEVDRFYRATAVSDAFNPRSVFE